MTLLFLRSRVNLDPPPVSTRSCSMKKLAIGLAIFFFGCANDSKVVAQTYDGSRNTPPLTYLSEKEVTETTNSYATLSLSKTDYDAVVNFIFNDRNHRIKGDTLRFDYTHKISGNTHTFSVVYMPRHVSPFAPEARAMHVLVNVSGHDTYAYVLTESGRIEYACLCNVTMLVSTKSRHLEEIRSVIEKFWELSHEQLASR